MSKFVIASALAVSALISGVAGVATAATKQVAVPAKMTAKPAAPAMHAAAAAPVMHASPVMHAAPAMHAAKPVAHVAAARPAATVGGRMVATKTSTGKAITYNCSKAGNANKKACK